MTGSTPAIDVVEVELTRGRVGDELAELCLAVHKGQIPKVNTIHIEQIERVGTSVGPRSGTLAGRVTR